MVGLEWELSSEIQLADWFLVLWVSFLKRLYFLFPRSDNAGNGISPQNRKYYVFETDFQ